MAKRKTLAKKGRKNRRTRRNRLEKNKKGGDIFRDIGHLVLPKTIRSSHDVSIEKLLGPNYNSTTNKKPATGRYTEEERKYAKYHFGEEVK